MPDGEVVRLRQVDRGEPHAAVPQRQQEGGVARQPVELGDHQRRPGDLGEVQRLAELRPVRVAPALHLGEAGDQRGAPLRDEAVDRLPLRLDPEPARALPRGRDPLVADDPHLGPSDQNCLTFVAQFCTPEQGDSVAK